MKNMIKDPFTPIHNVVLDALCKINLSSYETRVLFAILRKTYGFIDIETGMRKKVDYISVSQIAIMTNLDKRYVSRSLKSLKEKKVIYRDDKKTGFSKEFIKLLSSVEGTSPVEMTKNEGVSPVEGKGIPCRDDKVSPVEAPQIERKETITKEITIPNGIVTPRVDKRNPDINKILDYLREKLNLPELDLSEKVNRQYAYLLLRKSKSGLSGVLWLIDLVASDPWFRNHTTSVRDIWNNKIKIISSQRGGVDHGKPRISFINPA